jgi:hypothetical protein
VGPLNYWYWENNDEADILPICVYVEVDSELYERRKIELYQDNVVGYADDYQEIGRTGLSDRPLPSFEELKGIIKSPITKISIEQFEEVWKKYTK